MITGRLLLTWLAFLFLSHSNEINQVLVFNVLDEASIVHSIKFVESLPTSLIASVDLNIFLEHNVISLLSVEQINLIRKWFSINIYQRANITSHHRIGLLDPVVDYASCLLESLSVIASQRPNSAVISLTISRDWQILPSHNFSAIFRRFSSGGNENLLLLEKNRRLTSVSNWRDLLLVGMFSSPAVRSWLTTVDSLYFNHTNRTAFTLLDTRPALIEACQRHRASLRVGYLNHIHVCVEQSTLKHKHCSPINYMRIICRVEGGNKDNLCVTVNDPVLWHQRLNRKLPMSFESRCGIPKGDWSSKLIDAMWQGVTAFRNISEPYSQQQFCFLNG